MAWWTMLPALVITLLATPTGQEYPDGHGGKVFFPLGDVSFADVVVATDTGTKACKKKDAIDPAQTLSVPDYGKGNADGSYTLGCGGSLVVRFTDNALVDVTGPDLYVFEVGPQTEPTDLAISADGTEWVQVGRIEGGRAEVDIASFVRPGDVFHLVKLIDVKRGCNSPYPGADIDAVGAIGSGVQISLESAVLFATGESKLKPEALGVIDAAAARIAEYRGATVIVAGHTDAVGTPAANDELSQARAAAVRARLLISAGLAKTTITTRGYGAARPIASNDTPEGREKNRRVEIVILPAAAVP